MLLILEQKETGKNEISLVISDRKSPEYQLFGGFYCGWIFQIAVVKTGVLSDFYFHCHSLCRRFIFLISCSSDLYFQLVCAFFLSFFTRNFTDLPLTFKVFAVFFTFSFCELPLSCGTTSVSSGSVFSVTVKCRLLSKLFL